MKKISNFWKLFNKDNNYKTGTEKRTEALLAASESHQPTKESEKENNEKLIPKKTK